MATSLVSPLTSQLNHEAVCSKFVLPKSPFMSRSKLFSSNMPCSTVPRRTRRSHCFASSKDMSFGHIPKQFRGDNLKDGDHFKDILRSNPPQAGSQEEFSQWLCHVHNTVNRSVGKLVFPCERVDARWGKLECEQKSCDLHGTSMNF